MIEGTSVNSRPDRAWLAGLRNLFAGPGFFARRKAAGISPDFSYEPIPANPGPLLPEDRLVFVHIEKTAGSTAHHVFSQHFREDEICPYRFGNLGYLGSEYLGRFRYFTLHANLRMLRTIPQPTKFLTFVREPVARLLSHYNFWRSVTDEVVDAEGLDHIRFLKKLKLKELLAPSSLAVMPEFWNLTTQRFAGDLHFAPSGLSWRDEDELLDAALANLANFATLGVTEFPELSFQCIADDLALPNLYTGARINVTADNARLEPLRYDPVAPSDLDAETLECIDRVTRLDRVIYTAADQRFRDRLRGGVVFTGSVPPHLRTERAEDCEIVIGDHAHGAVLFGPYCTLPAGRYCATLWVQASAPTHRTMPWSVAIDVWSGTAQRLHAMRSLNRVELADRWFEPVEIRFDLSAPTDKIEIRLHANGLAALAVKRGIAIRLL